MALGAVTAAALTDHSAHYAMLTVAGVDLLLQPAAGAASGMRYGCDIESIIATERGPGQVSELNFILDDPLGQITLIRNQPVYFSKTAEVYPVFQGFVQSWQPEHSNANTGRRTRVRCVGLEIVLDWAILPAMSFAVGGSSLRAVEIIQSMIANVVNGLAFPLYAAWDPAFSLESTLQYPLAIANVIVGTPLTISAGTTLREGIRAAYDDTASAGVISNFLTTVDSGGRLRGMIAWNVTPGDFHGPTDWTEFYVQNDPSSVANGDGLALVTAAVAQDFRYEIDASTPSAVYVLGAPGVSAMVTDNTGDKGATAVISDPNYDTVARCISAGTAYLAQNFIQARASFRLDSRTPLATLRAGGTMFMWDNAMGLQGYRFRIMELERTFHGTLEDWKMAVGGAGQPSAIALIRNLTRSTLG